MYIKRWARGPCCNPKQKKWRSIPTYRLRLPVGFVGGYLGFLAYVALTSVGCCSATRLRRRACGGTLGHNDRSPPEKVRKNQKKYYGAGHTLFERWRNRSLGTDLTFFSFVRFHEREWAVGRPLLLVYTPRYLESHTTIGRRGGHMTRVRNERRPDFVWFILPLLCLLALLFMISRDRPTAFLGAFEHRASIDSDLLPTAPLEAAGQRQVEQSPALMLESAHFYPARLPFEGQGAPCPRPPRGTHQTWSPIDRPRLPSTVPLTNNFDTLPPTTASTRTHTTNQAISRAHDSTRPIMKLFSTLTFIAASLGAALATKTTATTEGT